MSTAFPYIPSLPFKHEKSEALKDGLKSESVHNQVDKVQDVKGKLALMALWDMDKGAGWQW
jgi:hypothetical protein